MKNSVKIVFVVALLLVSALLSGCEKKDKTLENSVNGTETDKVVTEEPVKKPKNLDWLKSKFLVLTTDQEWSIEELGGDNILLTSFGLNCPACDERMDMIQTFLVDFKMGGYPVSFVAVSLDTVMSEDTDAVRAYREEHHYPWMVANADDDFVNALSEYFDVDLDKNPDGLMALICEDMSIRVLEGVKTASDLDVEVMKGC